VPNFVKIGRSVAKIIRFFDFLRWQPSVLFGFVWSIFEPPTVSTWGLYRSTTFGYDRCSSFYNMNIISIFSAFGWKAPVHVPKIGVFGQFDPLSGLQYQPKPKKAHPCVSLHHLSHLA